MNKDYEILINQENPIVENFYKKFELIDILNIENHFIKIEKKTYENYLRLQEELKHMKIEIAILNSFRDFKEQENICREYIDIYGREKAYKLAAKPGTSEHHSGLAVDITVKKDDNNFAITNEELYSEDEKFKIVHKFLKKHGFILRYPKGKEIITKYLYEPWHIRYVGKDVAEKCFERKIVLEEYYNLSY